MTVLKNKLHVWLIREMMYITDWRYLTHSIIAWWTLWPQYIPLFLCFKITWYRMVLRKPQFSLLLWIMHAKRSATLLRLWDLGLHIKQLVISMGSNANYYEPKLLPAFNRVWEVSFIGNTQCLSGKTNIICCTYAEWTGMAISSCPKKSFWNPSEPGLMIPATEGVSLPKCK